MSSYTKLAHSILTSTVWMEDGVRVESQTLDPTAAVLDLSQRFGGEVPGLEIHRETLEDVYLSLLQGDRYDEGGDSE